MPVSALNKLTFSQGQQTVSIPLGSIVSHYRLDTDSTDYVDSHDGTDTDISYVSGKVSNGASFNGTTSQIDFGNNALFQLFTDGSDREGSISMWVNFDNTSGTQYLLNKRSTVATSGREYWFLYTGGELRFVLFDQTNGGNIRVEYSWTPTTGVWYHIVGTYDGSGISSGLNLYVDAVMVGSHTSTGTYVSQVPGVGEFVLGEANFGGSFFAGDQDEITLWQTELSLEQIELIKAEGDSGNPII